MSKIKFAFCSKFKYKLKVLSKKKNEIGFLVLSQFKLFIKLSNQNFFFCQNLVAILFDKILFFRFKTTNYHNLQIKIQNS